jgi:acetoin utilization deacetylase AcuC-like enzyme
MFRIRRIADGYTEANAKALAAAEEILSTHFPSARERDFADLAARLGRPGKDLTTPLVLVAEGAHDEVRAALLAHRFANPAFVFLDYLGVRNGGIGGGLGGALYQRLREITADIGGIGLFFECLPGDGAHCRAAAETLAENRKRLTFYARFGAYPIAGTAYELPVGQDADCPPHLMYDACGREKPLSRDEGRAAAKAILERKYGWLCPPDYVARVVGSFADDPVRLNVPKRAHVALPVTARHELAVIANTKHDIFHVKERGYVEAPVRVPLIRDALRHALKIEEIAARNFPDRFVTAVHDPKLVEFIRRCSAETPPGKSTYPYVFPIHNRNRPPKDRALHAGYYCMDTFTPINHNAWPAARQAVNCALTAAALCLEGRRFAYALVRPPGHHAERQAFGGFCYLNNAAIAANYLSHFGKVAVLDVDYHHGNGTQDIFWDRADVLTVSVHGHPRFAYPYFSGFEDEAGGGAGQGFNLNLPLKENASPEEFFAAIRKALHRIAQFAPVYLVVALGFDTAIADPTGSWSLRAPHFSELGGAIAAMGLPTAFVQEGGYRTRTLGPNALAFFKGVLGRI